MLRAIIREAIREGKFGQKPNVELKQSFLNTDFGLQLANKKFDISEKDVEEKIGRYSKGKYAGKLRGKIIWWKIIQGGFQPTGSRNESTDRVPGFLVREVNSTFGYRITDYEMKVVYWGPKINVDRHGHPEWVDDYRLFKDKNYINKNQEILNTFDSLINSVAEYDYQKFMKIYEIYENERNQILKREMFNKMENKFEEIIKRTKPKDITYKQGGYIQTQLNEYIQHLSYKHHQDHYVEEFVSAMDKIDDALVFFLYFPTIYKKMVINMTKENLKKFENTVCSTAKRLKKNNPIDYNTQRQTFSGAFQDVPVNIKNCIKE